MASTYLSRTFGTATSRKKFTLSMWVKLSGRGTGNNNSLLVSGASGQNEGTIKISSDAILWNEYNVGIGGSEGLLISNQLLRDYSAWYHLVFAWDSTNATADDRMKIYLGGEQVTSFSSRTNPSLNYDAQINNNIVHNIGRQTWNSSGFFDGSMSHIHFIDGTAYDASAFGSTDSTTGEWKINTSPSVTYGTNGFFVLKDGNSLTDQSPNTNNLTLSSGTLTKTEDCPNNLFATFNPLAAYKDNHDPNNWLKNGNTVIDTDGRSEFDWLTDFGTLGAISGKYYMELKINQIGSASSVDYGSIGIANDFAMSDSPNCTYGRESNDWGSGVYAYSFRFDSRTAASIALIKRENGTSTKTDSYQTQSSNLQVIRMAWDLDNGKIWFGRDGSWFNSGNPSAGTYAALTFTPNGRTFLPYVNHWIHNSGNNPIYSINFGNGYFGTSTVASAGTNASNNGIFEYDTPTGFTALSTKGLNE